MPLENKTRQLIEEIKLFIQYSVPENDLPAATALIDRYKNNAFVLRLFREYYANLPEAREEAVGKIVRLIDHQGVHLFAVWTASFSYLYAVSVDHVLFLGEYQQEVDTEVLSFFGLESQEEFLQLCMTARELKEYVATEVAAEALCPVCGVPEGESHLLGCTVEICPWCEGQLSYCNCRFAQLDTDAIEDEQQLETFLDMLTAKGRIPYKKSQAPAFPGTSGGLDDSQATG
ncbi:hypothetical protein FCL47_21950 [Desulfopila sp. IMCC35006]|uniref:hypothetical protein n=1 Tax=Desulfopila sp. IMCC35006 TaxID=2569542 RepID=UPI0010AC759D|nr:hypothetical protein [Desulfopila sp. IMCC35006]TKB23565.1 hypothetical protein FCL47_21950 [Desulfopila sp. IMCC35006]